MARALSLVALGLLYSFTPASGIRTKAGADDGSLPDILLNTDVSADESVNRHEFLEGNCGRLTVRGGLKVEESVKVTSNGWIREDDDFVVHLVTDETPKVAKLRQSEATEATPAGDEAGDTHLAEDDVAESEQNLAEQPVVPLVGVRIPGNLSVEDGKKAAVLIYKNNQAEPTEIALDTPAGPTTPFMVLFTQESPTEMRITVYTWQSQKTKTRAAAGKWHEGSAVVGLRISGHDTQVSVNASSPKFLKVYGSQSASLLTVEEGLCDEIDPPLVEIQPSPPQHAETEELPSSEAAGAGSEGSEAAGGGTESTEAAPETLHPDAGSAGSTEA